MKKIAGILLIGSFCLLSFAQEQLSQNIKGQVKDKELGIPLIGATIIIINSNPIVGTTTDVNGFFKIENINLGRQGIKVSYLGYEDAIINNLMVTSGKETFISVELEDKITEVEEVVIKAHARKDKAINDMALVSARSFSVEETERFAGSLGDPARMVANYAGVMTQNDSRNDIIIRGNSPMGLLWRLDGIEIPNPNHFGALGTTGGPVSILNNNLLTNSDFYTGAFPAEFSNATAGAFDLKMRSGNKDKNEYVGQVGFNGFELGAEGPISKQSGASYLVNYRYSTLGLIDALGFDLGTGSAIPEYQDITFKLDIPTKKLGRFNVFGIGGKSFIHLENKEGETSNSYNSSETIIDFEASLGVVGISNTYFVNENSRIKTSLSVQGSNSNTKLDSIRNNDSNNRNPYVRSDYTELKYSFNTQYKSRINDKNTFSIGFQYDYYGGDYVDSINNYEKQAFDIRLNTTGSLGLIKSYTELKHKFSNTISLYSGINYIYFPLNGQNIFEPRLGFQWDVAKTQSINIGIGQHSQMQPRMTYFYQTKIEETGEYIQTNKDLKFTQSLHFVLGYNNLITKNLRFKGEAYYQNITKVPISAEEQQYSLLNSGDFFAIPLIDSLINKGTGYNYGLELTLEKFLSDGYYFLITTSLFDSKYKGYDGVERNTAYNGNFVVNALGGYEIKIKDKNFLTIDIKTVWAGGKRYTPVDIEETINEHSLVLDWGNAYTKQQDYFRFDFRVGFRMNSKKFSQEWALDLQNLTNHKNLFMEEFDFNTMKPVKTYQQAFMPMMLYRIHF